MKSQTTESGLVVVDKPAGITSHDVVSRVRRLAGTRKVGHAGTLDPMATGILVLGVNRATRLLGHLLVKDKTYEATIRLGEVTTTDDAEGEVVSTQPTDGVAEEAIRRVLAAMVGEIEQRPSSVSAIKIDGRKAYDRVRAGEDVVLPSRTVRINSLEVNNFRWSNDGGVSRPLIDVTVSCSSGTYIRAIARDLGEALGVGGHLTALRRTSVGSYDLSVAHTLDELANNFTMLPLADAARAAFPTLELSAEQAADVRFGRRLDLQLPADGPVAVFDGTEFLALYEQGGDQAKAVAVFL
ncbi:MAG TPA: tRNA pseudouridine(55) synthase TruB [Marmoricola sp.]|nr:tRNA pseudouridine(55) synthase TruB [Marmoricola sp.]